MITRQRLASINHADRDLYATEKVLNWFLYNTLVHDTHNAAIGTGLLLVYQVPSA